MSALRWRVWYDDGSSFSDLEGEPHEAPGRGVQVVVQADPRTGRRGISGADYYIWKGDRWFGVDLFGLWDYLSATGLKVVKFGRYIERSRFEDILRRAEADRGFPLRSAWLPSERRPRPRREEDGRCSI